MPVQEVSGLSAEAFWARYGKKGAVGLVGGTLWIHRAICEAQALITPDHSPSRWAHAFIFTGKKPDGLDWIAESDLVIKPFRLKIVNGAQENRIEKYYGTDKALNCAVLDFGLTDQQAERVIRKALEMVSQRILYPVSGLFGTLLAYLSGTERWHNLWNTRNALYCSAFVQESYLAAGLDLAPKVATTNTGPDHLWQTEVPHAAYLLERS